MHSRGGRYTCDSSLSKFLIIRQVTSIWLEEQHLRGGGEAAVQPALVLALKHALKLGGFHLKEPR